ncbi:MAG: site-specific DNA-methyltransferase [Candidatus Sumerlaeota bacterium]|nr:site-specific DNA-methyltransferase [Candidatus Sumerlaeota bacterium]
MKTISKSNAFYNEDCIEGCRKHIEDNSVDLIVTDPPYGIQGDQLHRHYNRKEEYVLDGYIEVPAGEYEEFSRLWIAEAARILRPGGSIYVVSGYTHLIHILNALRSAGLEEINHLIWKYNFGVFNRTKYISSHYHILYYSKPGRGVTFNTWARFGACEKPEEGQGSLNYKDREDVWIINREYQPGKIKNKNQLPTELLTKIIQYSSNEGDLVCDLFLGSFSTAKIAIGLNRRAIGFEKSRTAFEHQMKQMAAIEPGCLLKELRVPMTETPENQNQPWTAEEKEQARRRYLELLMVHKTKRKTLDALGAELGRGYWSLLKLVKDLPAGSRERKAKREPPSDPPQGKQEPDLFSVTG